MNPVRYPWRAALDVSSHLVFLILIGFSAHFWFERMTYVDSAFQFFQWVQFDDLLVQQHTRFAALFPELVVKLFRTLGGDLKLLAVVASMAHALWPYLLFLFTRYVLRAPLAAWAMPLAMVLFMRHSFYMMVLESHLLACYPLVLIGWLEGGRRWGGTWGGLLIWLLLLTAHPLGLVAGSLMLAMAWWLRRIPARALLPFAGVVVLWSAIRFLLIPVSGYEGGMYRSLVEGIATPDWWELPQLKAQVAHSGPLSFTYLPGHVLMILAAGMMVARKAWVEAAVFTGGTVAYLMLVAFAYHRGENAVMLEKNLIFLGAWTAWAFVRNASLSGAQSSWRAVLILLVPLVSLVKVRDISLAGGDATVRSAAIRSLVVEGLARGANKYLIEPEVLRDRGVHVQWALSTETLLASMVDHGVGCTFTAVPRPFAELERTRNILLLPFDLEGFDQRRLDPRWFRVPPGSYHIFEPL